MKATLVKGHQREKCGSLVGLPNLSPNWRMRGSKVLVMVPLLIGAPPCVPPNPLEGRYRLLWLKNLESFAAAQERAILKVEFDCCDNGTVVRRTSTHTRLTFCSCSPWT